MKKKECIYPFFADRITVHLKYEKKERISGERTKNNNRTDTRNRKFFSTNNGHLRLNATTSCTNLLVVKQSIYIDILL